MPNEKELLKQRLASLTDEQREALTRVINVSFDETVKASLSGAYRPTISTEPAEPGVKEKKEAWR